jgi:hypothetical protein
MTKSANKKTATTTSSSSSSSSHAKGSAASRDGKVTKRSKSEEAPEKAKKEPGTAKGLRGISAEKLKALVYRHGVTAGGAALRELGAAYGGIFDQLMFGAVAPVILRRYSRVGVADIKFSAKRMLGFETLGLASFSYYKKKPNLTMMTAEEKAARAARNAQLLAQLAKGRAAKQAAREALVQ